ncbi:unnamed protein product [Nyctereutes procyonoides]|uniref:(raccoon dog) hypothetical protein n=1 Tax=Nyctereutes procyonoides TaxID=34880 RepID=A0A811ZKX8_NYCPR|nr:unnamed protein product [Nyctereutes procyonoides]
MFIVLWWPQFSHQKAALGLWHTLKVTSQETGIAPEDQIVLLAVTALETSLLCAWCYGSLAYAGKVRGQTPKIYNWCFVNVVSTFGKRKGSDANS